MEAIPVINIDQDLIDACKNESRSAQYEIYKRYHKAMYNTALRICGDEEDAEDVLQDAFVSAFQHIQNYRGESTFGSWLKRIVINKALNFLKKREKNREAMMLQEVEISEEMKPIDDLNEYELSVANIKKAMHLLPAGYRTVLSLYLFEGYDHQEISEIMGISESTSKSQLNRSKEKLRTLLKPLMKYG